MSIGDAVTEAIEGALAEAVAKASRAAGYDGVSALGGYVSLLDEPRILAGHQRWKVYTKIRRRAPVSIATQLRAALFAGVQWDTEPNPEGGPDAERAAEIVRRGLLEARLTSGLTWPEVVARAADGRYFVGHAVFATALGVANDGSVRYTDIAHRPQRTLARWLREVQDDESSPFVAVEQQSTNGRTVTLPLGECFYVVRKVSEDTPLGQGVLADIAERWDKLVRYEALEGSELFSSLGGLPVARAPLEDLRQLSEQEHGGSWEDPTVRGKRMSWIRGRVQKLYDVVAKRIKDPSVQQWLALDSATYKDPQTGARGGIRKWDVEIVKGELQGLADMRKIISDGDLDIARMLGVEYVFVGGGDTAGTFGMHESKISMLAATLSAESWQMARAGEDQLARRLVAANGLDPDTCTPYLVPSPIAVDDVLKATQALVALNAANLPRNHPAKRTIYDRLHLPWQDEVEAPMTLPGFGMPMPIGMREERSLKEQVKAALKEEP